MWLYYIFVCVCICVCLCEGLACVHCSWSELLLVPDTARVQSLYECTHIQHTNKDTNVLSFSMIGQEAAKFSFRCVVPPLSFSLFVVT